jgi:tetratricopeptide (TPR) repeat protein
MAFCKTKYGIIFLLMVLPIIVTASNASAQASGEEDLLLKEQIAIESDAGLSGRARRVIFRARASQDKGDFDNAIDVLSQWLNGEPDRNHHLLFYTRASNYEEAGNHELALADLETALMLEPRFGRAWLKLGETAYELERFSLAGDAFAQAYDLTPSAPAELLFYAGVTRLMGGESEKARGDLERLLLSTEKDAPQEWFQAYLATVQDAGPSAQTPGLVDRLLGDFEDDGAAWQLAAQDALGREEYEQAAIYLTIANFIEPLSFSELIQLGDIYAVINVPLKAARYIEQALASGEKTPEPVDYERLASAYLAAHKAPEARQAIARGLAVGETYQLWSLLGDLDYLDKDYAAALVDFEKCQDLNSDFGRGWLMMGYCAAEMGNNDQACQYLEQAENYPDQASSAGTLLRRLKKN